VCSTARAAQRFAARAVVVCAAVSAAACVDAAGDRRAHHPATVSFQTLESRPAFGAVDVAPLDEKSLAALERARPADGDWHEILSVYAGDSLGLPMLGSYSTVGDTLRFVPRFPPIRGTRYRARFSAAAFNAKSGAALPPAVMDAVWTRPTPAGTRTTVVDEVYPTADTVPMNLLRLYVQFSGPMTVGDRADLHVHLLDERGAPVDRAFLVATGEQELWDPDHTRLTLFLDPGRIKRDLTPHDELGLPLRSGHDYTLVVDSLLRDAHGLPLEREFTKHFRVGPVDRTLPRTSSWHLVPPSAGTTEPLTIEFPEPLDHALLARMLTVRVDGDEKPLAGRVSLENHDRRWRFTPDRAWRSSSYFVAIDTELEDLAGNNLSRLFDVMPGDGASRGVSGPETRIAFRPRD
jgi:hypothetical protein